MISVLTNFLRTYHNSVFDSNHFDRVIPLIVKFQAFTKKEDCDVRFDAILDLYQSKSSFIEAGYQGDDGDILDILSEAEYPQENEFSSFIALVKMVKDKYLFTHPKNKNGSKL